MIFNTRLVVNAGRSIGIVMCLNTWTPLAPSMDAASSYISGIDSNPAMKIIIVLPAYSRPFIKVMMATALQPTLSQSTFSCPNRRRISFRAPLS